MSFEEYKAARERADAAIAEARGLVKKAFNAGAKDLIEELGIESFGWRQYTPYFNDGDACIFSVHSDYDSIFVNGKRGDATGGGIYYSDTYPDDPIEREERKVRAQPFLAVSKFLNTFVEDDFLFMFDDHVKVTVYADHINVDEYDHD